MLGGDGAPGGFAGWLAEAALVQVDERTYLGAGCVVVATSPSTRRRHDRVTTAVTRGREAVRAASSVTTHFDSGALRTVVVLVDGSAGTLPQLSIGGAERTDGEPIVVQLGERTALVVGMRVTARAPSVSIADERGLGGVVATATAPADVAALLSAHGVSAIGPLTVTGASGISTVRWRAR